MTPTQSSYREIPISQGKVALVSEHRYEYLSQFTWYAFLSKSKGTSKWYATRAERVDEKQRTVMMHREILGLGFGDMRHSDHVNGDGLDNRDENIRIASVSQNMINRNGGEHRGIRKQGPRWAVRIKVQRKEVHIGIFDTEHDAQIAYAVAAKLLHGDFRHLSVLEEEQILAAGSPLSVLQNEVS